MRRSHLSLRQLLAEVMGIIDPSRLYQNIVVVDVCTLVFLEILLIADGLGVTRENMHRNADVLQELLARIRCLVHVPQSLRLRPPMM